MPHKSCGSSHSSLTFSGYYVQSSLHYTAADGILRANIESLLVNYAESFNEDQLAEIRIVLDQLRTFVRADEHGDEATGEKLDQLAQALRES